jgi:hypothetical protein
MGITGIIISSLLSRKKKDSSVDLLMLKSGVKSIAS